MTAPRDAFGADDVGVELISYPDVFQAGVVAARLTDAGVHAWTVEVRPGARTLATISNIYVRTADLDEARRLLIEFAEADGEDSPFAEPSPGAQGPIGRFLYRLLGGNRADAESEGS